MEISNGVSGESINSKCCPIRGKIILSKKINHLQYHQLSAAILADGEIDEEERYQINRLFDAIQLGQVKIVT
jgi:hypothetical protein